LLLLSLLRNIHINTAKQNMIYLNNSRGALGESNKNYSKYHQYRMEEVQVAIKRLKCNKSRNWWWFKWWNYKVRWRESEEIHSYV